MERYFLLLELHDQRKSFNYRLQLLKRLIKLDKGKNEKTIIDFNNGHNVRVLRAKNRNMASPADSNKR